MRRILIALALLFIGGTAHAACNTPNPNLIGPPFFDNCPLPASVLNRLNFVPTAETMLQAATTTVLKTFTGNTAGLLATRAGFAAAGDGGNTTYTFSASSCSLNSGDGDNGSQVKPTSGGGCWIANFKAIYPNVIQFGADPTGVSDSGPAFQAAYNATAGVEDCVFVPAGKYLIGTQVSINGNPPCFRGVKPNTPLVTSSAKTGTWIHITDTSLQPFLIAGTPAAGKGGFFDMGFYNDQPVAGAGWAPSAYQYPIAISSGGQDLEFRDLLFYNTTHCISMLTTGRVTFDNISGQPFGTCLTFDNVLDIVYLDHIHLWPFWTSNSDVLKYTQQNIDAIVFQRADSPMIGRVFTLGYRSAIKFASSGNGVTTGFQIDELQSDVGKYGVWVTGTNTQGHISSFRGASGNYDLGATFATGSECYRDESLSSDVMIANFQCFSSNDSAIHMLTTSNLRIGNIEVYACNQSNSSKSAVTMDNAASSVPVIAIANLPVVTGTLCSTQPFISAVAGSWFSAPSVRQSWTPTFIGTSSGAGSSYTAQYGQFWFDGTKVHLEFNVAATVTALVGNVSVGGLPFAATGLTNMRGSCMIAEYAGFTLDANYTVLTAVVPATASTIQLLENGSGHNGQLVPVSTLSAAANIIGSCEYQVN